MRKFVEIPIVSYFATPTFVMDTRRDWQPRRSFEWILGAKKYMLSQKSDVWKGLLTYIWIDGGMKISADVGVVTAFSSSARPSQGQPIAVMWGIFFLPLCWRRYSDRPRNMMMTPPRHAPTAPPTIALAWEPWTLLLFAFLVLVARGPAELDMGVTGSDKIVLETAGYMQV